MLSGIRLSIILIGSLQLVGCTIPKANLADHHTLARRPAIEPLIETTSQHRPQIVPAKAPLLLRPAALRLTDDTLVERSNHSEIRRQRALKFAEAQNDVFKKRAAASLSSPNPTSLRTVITVTPAEGGLQSTAVPPGPTRGDEHVAATSPLLQAADTYATNTWSTFSQHPAPLYLLLLVLALGGLTWPFKRNVAGRDELSPPETHACLPAISAATTSLAPVSMVTKSAPVKCVPVEYMPTTAADISNMHEGLVQIAADWCSQVIPDSTQNLSDSPPKDQTPFRIGSQAVVLEIHHVTWDPTDLPQRKMAWRPLDLAVSGHFACQAKESPAIEPTPVATREATVEVRGLSLRNPVTSCPSMIAREPHIAADTTSDAGRTLMLIEPNGRARHRLACTASRQLITRSQSLIAVSPSTTSQLPAIQVVGNRTLQPASRQLRSPRTMLGLVFLFPQEGQSESRKQVLVVESYDFSNPSELVAKVFQING